MTHRLSEVVLDAARAGEEAALVCLLTDCRPDLARYARQSCQSDDVEEAVQDALWILYRRVGALRTGAALSSWMFQVVRRLCLRFTRRRTARFQLLSLEPGHDMPANAAEDGLRLDLARAVARLPAGYRDVLILRDLLGFEASEVAVHLGLSVDAVKSRLHRARSLMREMLQPDRPSLQTRYGSVKA